MSAARESEILEKFELANEKIKSLISDYQSGKIPFSRFAASLLHQHSLVRSSLESSSHTLAPLLTKLEMSLSKILSGDEKYIATTPDSYHNILFQLHHMWVERIQKSGRPHGSGCVCGWEGREIPSEVDFALSHLPEALAVEGEEGWVIFSKTGALENHYCIIKREGDRLSLEYSDEDLPRTRAVSEVLGKIGMSWQAREISWIGEREITNYVIKAESPYDGGKVRSLVAVLRATRCLDILLLDVNRGEERLPANFSERSEMVQKEILEWCARNPEKCDIDWATVAVRADLAPLLRHGQPEDAKRVVRELLGIAETKQNLNEIIASAEKLQHERTQSERE